MSQLMERGMHAVMNTYGRFPIVLEKGEGVYVYDDSGKKYLDFVAGIAVNALGHGHQGLCNAIANQARKMIHVSNLYWTEPQITLAEKLVNSGCFDKAFFCNSGAEAVEGSLKLARKYAVKNGTGKTDIITMQGSFHGRTYGAVTATGQDKYRAGLSPMLPGVQYAPYNDFEGVLSMVTEKTGAILLEPLQGEGGIRVAEVEFLQKIRDLCDERDIMLIYDEVQCGVGRTGSFFAYQYFDVEPDVLTLAKGMAGGVPIGVLLAKDKFASAFAPGDHASTFGGNPLAAVAAHVVFNELHNGLLQHVQRAGKYLTEKLQALKSRFPIIQEVRGVGLIQGIELDRPVASIINDAMDNGLLLVNAGTHVIRFVPPLIVTEAQIDEAMEILANTFCTL